MSEGGLIQSNAYLFVLSTIASVVEVVSSDPETFIPGQHELPSNVSKFLQQPVLEFL